MYYCLLDGAVYSDAPLSVYNLCNLCDITDRYSVLICVRVPRNTPIFDIRQDKGVLYFRCNYDAVIAECEPHILTYMYGKWKEVVTWEEFCTAKSVQELLKNRGYILKYPIGFVTEKQLRNYTLSQKLLFG